MSPGRVATRYSAPSWVSCQISPGRLRGAAKGVPANREVWLDSPCLMVREEAYAKFAEAAEDFG